MNWAEGYKALCYAVSVNPNTWGDDGNRIDLISGSISRERTGLRQNAEFTADVTDNTEKLIRIYVDAVQGGDIAHTAVFTGYAVSPTISANGRLKTQKYSCYSVLKPADDVLLDRGWYAPASSNVGTLLKSLLSVTRAPLDIDLTPKYLANYIVAGNNESRLTMADRILQAAGWELVITGRGELTVRERPTTAVTSFSAIVNDIIEPAYSVTHDWFDVPNVLRVVMGDVSATVKDESETSLYSIANRGREIWQEENVEISSGDTLADYARRELAALQQVGTEVNYTRRYMPNVDVNDIVSIGYDGLNGFYKVSSQKISLGHNLTTAETVERVARDLNG